MTAMTQDEIITNTKTVIQGLEALKNENHSILSGLLASLQVVRDTTKPGDANTRLMEEKASIVQKSIETIELGLGEAQVFHSNCCPYIPLIGCWNCLNLVR